VRELPRANPDEIWVIQIDPEKRNDEPTSMADILDRRNELAGNISLYQEIDFIKKINHLVDKLVPDGDRNEKRLHVPGKEGRRTRRTGTSSCAGSSLPSPWTSPPSWIATRTLSAG